ncbi:hypothetical protein HNQ93_002569 [Hymenobacter luteus]|uniref:Uncharacterized protein n=2 Tax=Hymenobacter TaxID=89966 RepID=A0A7W9WBD2_9BACT|nr:MULTISPECIES: hypothetical protein [Hymenobacter]MBB6059709.1 hypothetical protein [Hymenobacter luteus]
MEGLIPRLPGGGGVDLLLFFQSICSAMPQLEELSVIKIDTLIAIIAAAAAVIALLISLRSNYLAKKSFQLSKIELDSKKSNFKLYLINALRFKSKENQESRILMFNISISNLSESKNSFKALLKIEYIRDDDSFAKTLIEHDHNLHSLIPNNNFSFFLNDINVSEKETESKWLLFKEPKHFLNYRIERYLLEVSDINGEQKQLESTLIKTFQLND